MIMNWYIFQSPSQSPMHWSHCQTEFLPFPMSDTQTRLLGFHWSCYCCRLAPLQLYLPLAPLDFFLDFSIWTIFLEFWHCNLSLFFLFAWYIFTVGGVLILLLSLFTGVAKRALCIMQKFAKVQSPSYTLEWPENFEFMPMPLSNSWDI